MITKTTWGQRVYLLANCLVMALMCVLMLRLHDHVFPWIGIPLTLFVLAIAAVNWRTTACFPPDWHDYR